MGQRHLNRQGTSLPAVSYASPRPRVDPHKDPGALAILAQDEVGGLEVQRKSDGQWVRFEPMPDAYIINLGDVFQVWTNGEYQNVEPRAAMNLVRQRNSIPFFMNLSHYMVVKPLEELTEVERPPKYRPYNWGKFQYGRKYNKFKKG